MMFTSAAWTAVLMMTAAVHAQPTGVRGYEATSLGVAPGRTSSNAYGVDDFGRLVGGSGSPFPTPFVWINGVLFVLPTPDGFRWPSADAIGNGGVVVGFATPLELPYPVPLIWTVNHDVQFPAVLPGMFSGTVRSVDDRTWPAASSAGACGATPYATLWSGVDALRIGTARSGADAINNLRHAVGAAENQQGVSRPMLWRDGQAIDIGGEPANVSGGAGSINEHGEIVGGMTDARLACHWYNGVRIDLPEIYPCGHALRKAQAINDSGLIVGMAPDAYCATLKAAIWDRKQGFRGYIINDYMPRHPEIDLLLARDINDAGQVAAYGEPAMREGRGYLVTPYLFEMSDPVPGRAGTANTITVTGLQPNQRVHLVWGTQDGAQKIRPACPGGTLLIRDPQALPRVRADASGEATIAVNVPLIARGRTVRLQAVAPIECQISHTVSWTFY